MPSDGPGRLPNVATTQHSVRVVKKFMYRGDPLQEWSNRYYFDGGAPADTAAWHALFDELVLREKVFFKADVTIIGCHGYAPGSEVAVANKDYTQAGTATYTGSYPTPGDCAAVLRMATTKRSTKNHVVYVMSYFHGVRAQNSGENVDELWGGQRDAMDAYGLAWKNGITVGARTYKRTTPDGALTTGATTNHWITHRDFPR